MQMSRACRQPGNRPRPLRVERLVSGRVSSGSMTPPEVGVVREITLNEYEEVIGTCMKTAGFPPAADGDQPGLAFNFPDEQVEQANLALYICQSEYPIAARFQDGLGGNSARAMYRHLVESYLP